MHFYSFTFQYVCMCMFKWIAAIFLYLLEPWGVLLQEMLVLFPVEALWYQDAAGIRNHMRSGLTIVYYAVVIICIYNI